MLSDERAASRCRHGWQGSSLPWLMGFGLVCPAVMAHGNREGFDHLSTLCSRQLPAEPVGIDSW